MMWVYILLGVTGFMPLLVVLYKMNKVKQLKKNGVRTTGTVQMLEGVSQRNLNTVLLEYTVKETGQVISKKIMVGGLPYQPGDQLPLYYNPKNPLNMQLDSGKSFIFLLVFTILIAAFFIAACILLQSI